MTETEFDLTDKRILVTDGAGFLGKQVINYLCKAGADPTKITVPRSHDCDLRLMENCQQAVDQ
jgi:GDP-L-fucose synthase